MKTPLICACSLYFPLINYAIPPGHAKNIPMQQETIHISMCTLPEQKPSGTLSALVWETIISHTSRGRHLCAVQSSYGKQPILNMESQQKR